MNIDERLKDSAPRLQNAVADFALSDSVIGDSRRTSRRRAAIAGFAIVMLAMVAVVLVAVRTTSGSRKPTTPPPASKEYAVDATVLESSASPPELCVGLVLDSNPPQCSGATVVGLDWTTAPGVQTVAGVTWAELHVVGTYDDARYTFTLTQPPAPRTQRPQPSSAHKFDAECPAPSGGWRTVDPSNVTLADYQAMSASVPTQSGYVGMWLDSSSPVDGRAPLIPNQVITFAFTGQLAEHRAQIEALWGGPICVVQRARSRAQLDAIVQAVGGPVGHELGLRVVSGGIVDDVANVITVDVMLAPPGAQHVLDQRYGDGVVRLHQVLTPVNGRSSADQPVVATTVPPIPPQTHVDPTKAEIEATYNAALQCIRDGGVVITSSKLTITSNGVQTQLALDYVKSGKTPDEVSAIEGRCRGDLINITDAWNAAHDKRLQK